MSPSIFSDCVPLSSRIAVAWTLPKFSFSVSSGMFIRHMHSVTFVQTESWQKSCATHQAEPVLHHPRHPQLGVLMSCAACKKPAAKTCARSAQMCDQLVAHSLVRCKVVRYCSVECQRSHFPEHTKSCKQQEVPSSQPLERASSHTTATATHSLSSVSRKGEVLCEQSFTL